jgi:hypothetical protein
MLVFTGAQDAVAKARQLPCTDARGRVAVAGDNAAPVAMGRVQAQVPLQIYGSKDVGGST